VGSYFFTDLVEVFGITTFTGFGGSFFTIGFIWGFTETKDLFSWPAGFFSACLAGFTSGFFGTTFTGALATFLGAGFLATGFAGFLGAGFGAAFLGAGFLAITFFTGFAAFFAAGFFFVAIRLSFF
jgi:hypothetical protein